MGRPKRGHMVTSAATRWNRVMVIAAVVMFTTVCLVIAFIVVLLNAAGPG